jgi:cellulose synthase/poly-beta-1,6-N-acetylglucosamine synthase-like glycosyltransferase
MDTNTKALKHASRGRAVTRVTPHYTKRQIVGPASRGVNSYVVHNSSVGLFEVLSQYASSLHGRYHIPANEVTPKRKLALLLPGHNEELIIGETIQSAIKAGQDPRDVYVVDDNSDDKTREIAVSMLGKDHVLTVGRSGKALAVQKAIAAFKIADRYIWVHVADADGIFAPRYFEHYIAKLDETKYAVAVGFVQAQRGNWISTYRALTYTYSQHVYRRMQAKLGMISVLPGPITSYRTDILKELEFDTTTVTEDFDITLQIYRKNLGKMVFIPKAINYTQEPASWKDFVKQNMRWQRGFWQGVMKYKIGRGKQRIDISLGFQMGQTFLFLFQIFFLIPIIMLIEHNYMVIPVCIAADIVVYGLTAIIASAASKKWHIFGILPFYYILHWTEIFIYFYAFTEVVILKRFKGASKGWGTEGRRYKLDTQALNDVTA